jgi:hypothetical protein
MYDSNSYYLGSKKGNKEITSDKDYVFNIKNYKQKGEYMELATNMYYPS